MSPAPQNLEADIRVRFYLSRMTADLDVLPTPTTLAGLPLSSHFVMAPMTRKRSPGGVPTAEVAAYYRRRAGRNRPCSS